MMHLDSQTLLLAILAVVAVAILGQAILLLAIYFVVRRTARSLQQQAEDLRDAVMPIVDNTRELVRHIAPRIEDTIQDLAATAHGLRAQTAEIQSSATEVVDKLRRQCVRLDGMISTVFNAVEHLSGFVSSTVARPVRQLSGILASAKAIIETLRTHAAPAPEDSTSAPQQPAPGSPEKDMFV